MKRSWQFAPITFTFLLLISVLYTLAGPTKSRSTMKRESFSETATDLRQSVKMYILTAGNFRTTNDVGAIVSQGILRDGRCYFEHSRIRIQRQAGFIRAVELRPDSHCSLRIASLREIKRGATIALPLEFGAVNPFRRKTDSTGIPLLSVLLTNRTRGIVPTSIAHWRQISTGSDDQMAATYNNTWDNRTAAYTWSAIKYDWDTEGNASLTDFRQGCWDDDMHVVNVCETIAQGYSTEPWSYVYATANTWFQSQGGDSFNLLAGAFADYSGNKWCDYDSWGSPLAGGVFPVCFGYIPSEFQW